MQRMPLSTPRTVLRSRCALLAGLCLLAAAHATADGPDFYRVSGLSPGSSVPLRAAPQADAPAVGRIRADATCGTPFHAQATVVCRQASAAGQTGACSASMIRYQRPGSATVEPRWSEAGVPRLRRLLFVDGRAVDSDAVDMPRMQGPGDPCRIDLVADERHEFPHALVSGG